MKYWIIFGIGILFLSIGIMFLNSTEFLCNEIEYEAKDITIEQQQEWICKLEKSLELELPKNTDFIGFYYKGLLNSNQYAKVQFKKEQADEFLSQSGLSKYHKTSDDISFFNTNLIWFDYTPEPHTYIVTKDNKEDLDTLSFALSIAKDKAELFIFWHSK